MTHPTARQQAVIDEPGNCLVVAGPGSGKTATMVKKIAKLLTNASSRIVAVTFTRDGANELMHRLRAAVPASALGRVTVGTFHSLTLRHMRANKMAYKLASPQQQREFLKRARMRFAQDVDPGEIQLAFESIKCTLDMDNHPSAQDLWFQAYQESLQRHHLIDLLDVMREAVKAFKTGKLPPLPCTHMVVDEAQDNDEIQAAWVAAHRVPLVTMVGDDDQTIFEWRRAIGFPGMLAFQRERNARVLLLEDNFRSHSEILSAASHVIRHNDPHRNKKTLVPRKGPGGSVKRIVAGSLEDTCGVVADLILPVAFELEDSADSNRRLGVTSGTWAVLARTNFLLDTIESFLVAENIKTFRASGSIWDTQPAQAALQALRALYCNDSVGLDFAMHHARLSSADVAKVLESCPSIESLLHGTSPIVNGLEAPKDVAAFFNETAQWLQIATEERGFAKVVDLVCRFVHRNLEAKRRQPSEPILEAVRSRLGRIPRPPADSINLLMSESSRKTSDNAVMLYTMHGSKGLEFENVVIAGMDSAVIPGDAVDYPPGSPLIQPGQSTVQSERRLFYVAMTRAKRNLYIAHSFASPSLFIAELPDHMPTIGPMANERSPQAQARMPART